MRTSCSEIRTRVMGLYRFLHIIMTVFSTTFWVDWLTTLAYSLEILLSLILQFG